MTGMKRRTIPRDISWLAFNGRVLQEAADTSVPLRERIKFLGIFSNNMDEFFRVRVATLKRMAELGSKIRDMHLEQDPAAILERIQEIVLAQQAEFGRIWQEVRIALEKQKIFLVKNDELNREQRQYVKTYFEEEVRSNVTPLMVESIPNLLYLREKSLYLGIVLSKKGQPSDRKYAVIELPAQLNGRFHEIPAPDGERHIILLEDVLRYNLPNIFSFFGYNRYASWVFKVTKDAEMDIDNDVSTSFIQKIEKGLKSRHKAKPVRFVYDQEMDPALLELLMKKLMLTKKDSLIPGGRTHNFRHFMDFPDVFSRKSHRKKPFAHPLLKNSIRVTDVILKHDVMLNFPYHSFNPVIDLLREAAIDPEVTAIKITAYRLAPQSKIINALVNAARNGKQVTVMLELRARFDEEANIEWKNYLELQGVKVLISIPNLKVHAKICMIKKRRNKHTLHYGFVATGNLNEKTATVYGDHCLLTANRNVMADVNRMFNFLEKWKDRLTVLKSCKTLIPCPTSLRKEMHRLINREIRCARAGKESGICLKMNSLSDEDLIIKLYEAARVGVKINLIIRGIFCMFSESKKFVHPVKAISIVDEYLEHARVFIFHNGGHEKVYISSADWMVRNLDHRVEVTCPIRDAGIRKELIDMFRIQLSDNVKARKLDNELQNAYVQPETEKRIRSQEEIYRHLQQLRYEDDKKK